MILRRRGPRATRPCDQTPAPSGPRGVITAVIAATAATSGGRPSSRTSPVAPHTSITLQRSIPARAPLTRQGGRCGVAGGVDGLRVLVTAEHLDGLILDAFAVGRIRFPTQ